MEVASRERGVSFVFLPEACASPIAFIESFVFH